MTWWRATTKAPFYLSSKHSPECHSPAIHVHFFIVLKLQKPNPKHTTTTALRARSASPRVRPLAWREYSSSAARTAVPRNWERGRSSEAKGRDGTPWLHTLGFCCSNNVCMCAQAAWALHLHHVAFQCTTLENLGFRQSTYSLRTVNVTVYVKLPRRWTVYVKLNIKRVNPDLF